MEAEGHGAGAYRLDPVATVAARRDGTWSDAAVLRLCLPAQEVAGRVALGAAAKFADGKLTIVNAFDVKEPKTKQFRTALEALKVESTVLIVEAPNAANRNLELSARNIKGWNSFRAMKCILIIC